MEANESVLARVYPELPAVLGDFVAELRQVLERRLVGVYLVGSLATGDFDRDSDIEFLAILSSDLEGAEVRVR